LQKKILVRESAARVTRVAVLRDATTPQGIGLFAVIRSIASALDLELRPIGLRDADEIERGIMAFVGEGDGGLIGTASGPAIVLMCEVHGLKIVLTNSINRALLVSERGHEPCYLKVVVLRTVHLKGVSCPASPRSRRPVWIEGEIVPDERYRRVRRFLGPDSVGGAVHVLARDVLDRRVARLAERQRLPRGIDNFAMAISLVAWISSKARRMSGPGSAAAPR
jgi:hypothetical protein